MPRRYNPASHWLSAFEAVERLGSVTAAALELDLTQGAVSRQIQKLEESVGLALFSRNGSGLRATPHGAAYAIEVRQALGQITNATIALCTNPNGGILNLAVLPAFGAHWLAPRLPDFLALHPGITLNLTTRVEPFDFRSSGLHGAIHFGRDDWPSTGTLKLWDEETVAVTAPSLLANAKGTVNISALPRLQLISRPDAWSRWFECNNLPPQGGTAMVVDQFATMLRAAEAGLGVALMPRYLVKDDIAAGRVIEIPNCIPFSAGAYYLVWPMSGEQYPALTALRSWIMTLRT